MSSTPAESSAAGSKPLSKRAASSRKYALEAQARVGAVRRFGSDLDRGGSDQSLDFAHRRQQTARSEASRGPSIDSARLSESLS